MYHAKRIGVFISHLFGVYQTGVCQGIIDRAKEFGYAAEIYASVDGENLGGYDLGEDSIASLPDFDTLDGVIFASGTYISAELRERIAARLQEACRCPIVDVTGDDTLWHATRLDNNTAVAELTEHLIRRHGCKRLRYLGCANVPLFSSWRERLFRETCAAAGIALADTDLFDADSTPASVEQALERFLLSGVPDAVVCYNDSYALRFIAAAQEASYRVPEDIAVVGNDNLEAGGFISPALTTVSFPVYELGAAAADDLIALIHGKDLPQVRTISAAPILRSSCGCAWETPSNIRYHIQEESRIADLEGAIFRSMGLTSAFQSCHDIDEGIALLKRSITGTLPFREFYLCLYADWDNVSRHVLEITANPDSDEAPPARAQNDEVLLKLAFRDGQFLAETSFRKTQLLPEHLFRTSDHALVIMPLYFGRRVFGYFVFSCHDDRVQTQFPLALFLMNITQMLRQICEARSTGLMVDRLETLYLRDPLTGINNRHGYERLRSVFLARAIREGQNVTCYLFELQSLREINERHGHDAGDFAQQIVGSALLSVARDGDLLAHLEPDRFLLLGLGEDEEDAELLVKRVRRYIGHHVRLSEAPYEIALRCEHSISEPACFSDTRWV